MIFNIQTIWLWKFHFIQQSEKWKKIRYKFSWRQWKICVTGNFPFQILWRKCSKKKKKNFTLIKVHDFYSVFSFFINPIILLFGLRTNFTFLFFKFFGEIFEEIAIAFSDVSVLIFGGFSWAQFWWLWAEFWLFFSWSFETIFVFYYYASKDHQDWILFKSIKFSDFFMIIRLERPDTK